MLVYIFSVSCCCSARKRNNYNSIYTYSSVWHVIRKEILHENNKNKQYLELRKGVIKALHSRFQ